MALVCSFASVPAARAQEATTRPATSQPATLAPTETSWPMFRGGARLTGVAACVLPARLEKRWEFRVSEPIESSAAIEHGTVYVGADDGHLYALDLKTGKLRWKFKTAPSDEEISMVRSSPMVHGGAVYFGDDGGTLFCLDAHGGQERWRFTTDGEIISGANVYGNALIFGSYDGFVYGLTLEGELRWKSETQGPVHATPAVLDGRVLIAGCDAYLRVLDANTGEEKGKVELGAYTGASPAVVESTCYMGTFGERVLAIDWKRQDVVWYYEHATRRFPYLSSAAATDAAVYVGGRDKIVRGLERATGRPLWEHPTGARVESSPAVSGGRVYVGSGDGKLYAFDAQTGRVEWEFDTGAPISASPAIADGCLVIGTQDGVLYCFSGTAGEGPNAHSRRARRPPSPPAQEKGP